MQITDNSALLRKYVENHSDEAFAGLVTQHINLVYSVALRHVGDPHHAEEVTQAVFIILARKAGQLRHDKALSSWLFQTTRLTAGNFSRSEIRRRRREQEAYMQSTLNESEGDVWPRIAPLLDTAVEALSEKDRRAIVLRFYEGRNLREVGAALDASEAAAEKRVLRAVEKLRLFFTKRGVVVPIAALTAAISTSSVQAAPIGLATSVTLAAAKGTVVATSTLTLVEGALKIMAWTKTQTVVVGTIVVACVVVPLAIQHQDRARLRDELRQRVDETADLRGENQRLSDRLAIRTAMPRLPAPRIPAAAAPAQSLGEPTDLFSRLLNGEDAPKLTADQIESYLDENQRSAASLVAAFRATGDQNLLREAMEKYPNDPLVNFAAIFNKSLSPEERRQQLDALKDSAPENALGNFLSALDYFKAGETDRAVQELSAAFGKTQFQDFTADLIQNATEAYLAAGYSVAEAKTLANSQVLLPHLSELKQLGQNMIELANSYRQAGDETSAQAALQIAANLGQRFNGSPGEPLISHLVGMTIERNALNAMDPNAFWQHWTNCQ